jgi:hypothetical protein
MIFNINKRVVSDSSKMDRKTQKQLISACNIGDIETLNSIDIPNILKILDLDYLLDRKLSRFVPNEIKYHSNHPNIHTIFPYWETFPKHIKIMALDCINKKYIEYMVPRWIVSTFNIVWTKHYKIDDLVKRTYMDNNWQYRVSLYWKDQDKQCEYKIPRTFKTIEKVQIYINKINK